MFNIHIKLNYGVNAVIEDINGNPVRLRHGEEAVVSRTMYNAYRTEMCSSPVTISNKKIVAQIPKYTFRFEKIKPTKKADKETPKANDPIQTN